MFLVWTVTCPDPNSQCWKAIPTFYYCLETLPYLMFSFSLSNFNIIFPLDREEIIMFYLCGILSPSVFCFIYNVVSFWV
eukprot:c33289_g1_i1 orf=234-470(+)